MKFQDNTPLDTTTTMRVEKEIVLIPSQEAALEELLIWEEDTDLFHSFQGSAGTGKTTTLKEYIRRSKFAGYICVSAPTHKAKKQVQSTTGLQAFTIQALLGLKPNTDVENFDINNPNFDQLGEKQIANQKVVVIDEASMLNADLHELICQEARRFRVKVLFVGDPLQLPPVKESSSKALRDHPSSLLTEIIRQSNVNPLSKLLAALRYDIENNTETFFKILKESKEEINDRGEGYMCLQQNEFQLTVVNHYGSAEFRADTDYCKFVAWTNECVNEWNKFIRGTLFTGAKIVTKGDLLMAYNTISDNTQNVIITNSEEYIPTSVIDKAGFEDYNISNYLVIAERADMPLKTVFNILSPESTIDFLGVERELHQTAMQRKGRAWVQYYAFRRKFLLIEPIKHNGKLIIKKDIDYGYAITVHKTQGSTYNTTFVHLPNIMRNYDNRDRKKLMYVALSRASHKAVILINPDSI